LDLELERLVLDLGELVLELERLVLDLGELVLEERWGEEQTGGHLHILYPMEEPTGSNRINITVNVGVYQGK
jgi:hypothetical protein